MSGVAVALFSLPSDNIKTKIMKMKPGNLIFNLDA
jgi:hypothetical protein